MYAGVLLKSFFHFRSDLAVQDPVKMPGILKNVGQDGYIHERLARRHIIGSDEEAVHCTKLHSLEGLVFT